MFKPFSFHNFFNSQIWLNQLMDDPKNKGVFQAPVSLDLKTPDPTGGQTAAGLQK